MILLLVIVKWYCIYVLASIATLGILYIHDRIKYGSVPITKDNEDM
jgi:hypothetical protein